MKISRVSFFIVCGLSVSGCSTIQSWFPDKEKDYQFTTELSPLVIPLDLVQKTSLPNHSVGVDLQATKTEKPVKPQIADKKLLEIVKPAFEMANDSVTHPDLPDEVEARLNRNDIQVSLTHENVPTLNLNVPSARAWRIVGKALSRSGIEITNRNQEGGQIVIQFADSTNKTEPEKSLWDNTISVFNPFAENEQNYILNFTELNAKTSVTVLNPQLQTIVDGASNKILTILFDAIKADLSK